MPVMPVHYILLFSALVYSLERWDGRTFLLIQSVAYNSSVGDIDLAMSFLLEGQGMLHPVLVISVGVVFSGVGTTGLLSCGSSSSSLGSKIVRDSCIK